MQIPGKYADWQQEIKGIPTNGESVKVRCPAAVLLFIRRYQNTEPPGQYPEFSGSKIALSVFLKVAKAPFPLFRIPTATRHKPLFWIVTAWGFPIIQGSTSPVWGK